MTFFNILRRGSRFERAASAYQPLVARVNEHTDAMHLLSDDALKERIRRYRGRPWAEISQHTDEIFAAVREAAERVLKMRHFDVQVLGGFALLEGKIAEMKTGEGKTLVATLPLITRALTGHGAHLITVNDYLAQRDAAWMGPLYAFFDLSVGTSVPGQTPAEKHAAYAADITYGTNNEFGFDYLRDNMANTLADLVQRDLTFGIVDEVDSILIDEARTPLIISAPDAESTQLYGQFSRLVPRLKEGADYNIDEKRRTATLTDEGISRVEEILGIGNIYTEGGIRFVHHLEQALRAQTLYRRDKDYVVREGQVVIVDEFTGRLLAGRRYAEGLHQAIEAKEGVTVQQESRTLATITFQNFFRLYNTLAGMTGTAVTSAEEFEKVYNLEVVAVPTNRLMVRHDRPDRIFVNEAVKFTAVTEEIKHRHHQGQPVLVGTIAIEKSELLAEHLQREGIPHEVLNAKHHAREAEIITKAGERGAVTISTNMAGRGTDIKLGDSVAELGGLFVLGTERHEARRIDNQLRGRSGRQGDPGETQFFVSLEDDVMRIFGGERIRNLMRRLKLPEDEPIENRLVNRALEGAQERVEGYYFDMRKQVLSYDDVLNRQRTAIYRLRRGVLLQRQWVEAGRQPADVHEYILAYAAEQAAQLVATHAAGAREKWNVQEMAESAAALTGTAAREMEAVVRGAADQAKTHGPEAAREQMQAALASELVKRVQQRAAAVPADVFKQLEQAAAMRAIDVHWMDHLDTMDYLRAGIGLRGYGQRDPLVEYQKEGYQLFQRLLENIKTTLLETVLRAQPALAHTAEPAGVVRQVLRGGSTDSALHQLTGSGTAAEKAAGPAQQPLGSTGQLRNPYRGVGRNDLCPCGSGKKFKKCHGQR
ncbi:MAG: preprotein translocase subunit SecA [Candidatus Andersenbacteria bacterium]|nr:preprotein translocase subunit SecA [Candidatus Andersenbacteria bacterium]